MLNSTPVTNVFLSCTLVSMFFFSDDVLRKHVGPSSMQKYRKVTDYGTKCYYVSPIRLLRLVFL